MSHRLTIHWKPWLPLGAAVFAAGLLVNAQAPEEKPDSAGGPASSITGKVTAGRGISVVWLEAPGKTFPKPAKPFAISQKSLRFMPHVLMVPAGAVVDFQNGDDVQHNIFWPAISGDKKLGHTLGTWPKGQARKFEFTTPGIVPLLCNVHPEMSAYLIVTPTPYGAETDEAGSFTIPEVPGGTYTMKAWHEGFKTQSKPIMVASDMKVDFTLAK
jgi:plastocyanin